MTRIEFITSSRVEGLQGSNLYDFILERVLDDRIVVLEKELDPSEQMELIAKGLENVTTESGRGINLFPFFVTTQVNGIIRSKQQEVQFNLIAPGTSKITQDNDGHYSVVTENGEYISAAF